MWRYTKYLITLLGLSVLVSTPARAEMGVNLNINVGVPPPIEVEAPPSMVYLAEPGVYVAVGVPYDLFFVGGRYYYYHGDHWFWARGYGGPWVYVADRSVPRGLRRYDIARLHAYREHEFQRYTTEGPRYRGRHFAAVPGRGPHEGRRFGH